MFDCSRRAYFPCCQQQPQNLEPHFSRVQFSTSQSQRTLPRDTIIWLALALIHFWELQRTRFLDHFSRHMLQGRKFIIRVERVANCCRAYWHNLFTQFASAGEVQLTTLVPRVLLINYVVRKSGVQREVSSRPPVKCRHNSLPALSTLHFSLVIKAQAGSRQSLCLLSQRQRRSCLESCQ